MASGAPNEVLYPPAAVRWSKRIWPPRTASRQAGFFLDHLRVGMDLLDCGCGPGSTTLDFAAAIAPGRVEGVDIGGSQIASARARAVERGLTNAHFQVGTIYELP